MIHLAHVETNVTIACTRRCTHCNHFVPAQVDRVKASMATADQLRDDLYHFGRIAHTEGYAFIGGEPLLHPRLTWLAHEVRKHDDVFDRLEVWTNGEKLKDPQSPLHTSGFWYSFDLVVVSVYPGVLDDNDLDVITQMGKKYQVPVEIKDERVHPNFTRLLVPDQNEYTNTAATAARYAACWFKTYSRVLDFGYFFRCCTSPFILKVLEGGQHGDDGLKIDAHTTEHQLRDFLDQPQFMESCRRCAGRNTAEAVPVVWGEEKDPAAWIRKSAEVQER